MNRKKKDQPAGRKSRAKKRCTPPPTGLLNKSIKPTSAKSVKKILAQAVVDLQDRSITGAHARSLAYTLQAFMQVLREVDLEHRVAKLEKSQGMESVDESTTENSEIGAE
jgi:hypothetical protein